MEFSNSDYGDVFADVYDKWYHDLDDVDQVVSFVSSFAQSNRVLELGVGTGRLAIPLADSGLEVVGIDNSALMLNELAPKVKANHRLTTTRGHMVADMPEGPFGVVFLPYNTLFNLMSAEEQTECLRRAGQRLAPNGVVIVDIDLDKVAPEGKTSSGNKVEGLTRTAGHLGFCGHGDRVAFRNLRVKKM